MRNLKLLVQYAGTGYAGWQVQPSVPTIQGVLQDALGRIVGHPVRIVGAGRTDAGTHARGQVASTRARTELPADRLRGALNALLPPAIRVVDLCDAPEEFHALGKAVRREYRYEIVNAEVLPPFLHGFALQVRSPLDRGALREAAARVLGEHDFRAFCSSDRGEVRTRRRIEVSEWLYSGDLLVYRVAADGFVKGMVRALVGTFLEVGRGKRTVLWVDEVLRSLDRARAGPCLPAHGLYLEKVDYA